MNAHEFLINFSTKVVRRIYVNYHKLSKNDILVELTLFITICGIIYRAIFIFFFKNVWRFQIKAVPLHH